MARPKRSGEKVDVAGDLSRRETRFVTLHRNSLPVEQEFFEVPADVVVVLGRVEEPILGPESRVRRGAMTLEESVQRVLVFPVHLDLLEHGEVGHVVLARSHVPDPVKDLLARTRLLLSKLVAREAEHGEVPAVVPSLQCIQLRVGVGEASVGGQVHHEHHVTPESAQGDGVLLQDVLQGDVVREVTGSLVADAVDATRRRCHGQGHRAQAGTDRAEER